MYCHFIKKAWREAQFRWPSEPIAEKLDAPPLSPEFIAEITKHNQQLRKRVWRNPSQDMLDSPEFEAVWKCIRTWDVNVPEVYIGYMGATGNHVRAILDALDAVKRRTTKST